MAKLAHRLCLLHITTPRKQTERRSSFTIKCIHKKKDFIRFLRVRIAAAVDKINKMADCRFSRLERKQGKILLVFSNDGCIIK